MAVEPGDADFKSGLDAASRKKAKDELKELNDKDREIAVQTFRQWVIEQPWLRSPTDFEFLLRFLRARKFSQLSAREYIQNFWKIKTKNPQIYSNIDPADKVMQDIIRSGWAFSPKTLDKYGRRVCYILDGNLNENRIKKEWGVQNMFKFFTLIVNWLMCDENVQVNGLVLFVDHTNQSLSAMITVLANDIAKKFAEYFENALPARIKGLHIYNERPFVSAVTGLIMPFMKQKTRDRMCLHGKSLVKIYEEIGMSVIPKEYLPDDYTGACVGTVNEVIEEMIADMTQPKFRDYILAMSGDKYGVDLQNIDVDKDVPVASFRKLNVD